MRMHWKINSQFNNHLPRLNSLIKASIKKKLYDCKIQPSS